jgi:phosphate transport system permease protein
MTSAMAQLAQGSDQVVGNTLAFQSLFFVGALLFIMTLASTCRRRSYAIGKY